MEPITVFNLYAHKQSEQLPIAKIWAKKLRDEVNVLNSSAARISLLFDPVMRSVARSFYFAGEMDESLKSQITVYEQGNFPRLTISRAFEIVALDICKEIISENDISSAAQLIYGAPQKVTHLLDTMHLQAA